MSDELEFGSYDSGPFGLVRDEHLGTTTLHVGGDPLVTYCRACYMSWSHAGTPQHDHDCPNVARYLASLKPDDTLRVGFNVISSLCADPAKPEKPKPPNPKRQLRVGDAAARALDWAEKRDGLTLKGMHMMPGFDASDNPRFLFLLEFVNEIALYDASRDADEDQVVFANKGDFDELTNAMDRCKRRS